MVQRTYYSIGIELVGNTEGFVDDIQELVKKYRGKAFFREKSTEPEREEFVLYDVIEKCYIEFVSEEDGVNIPYMSENIDDAMIFYSYYDAKNYVQKYNLEGSYKVVEYD